MKRVVIWLCALGCGGTDTDTDADTDVGAPDVVVTAADRATTVVTGPADGRFEAVLVGDLSGDGQADLLLSGGRLPAACAFFGPLAAGDLAWESADGCIREDNGALTALATLDANGDGQLDLLAGASTADVGGTLDAGRAYLLLGPLGQGEALAADAHAIFDGEAALDAAGFTVAALNDEEPSVVIGAYGSDTNGPGAGRMYVYSAAVSAGTHSLAAAPTIIQGLGAPRHSNSEGGEAVGYAVATGDLDGDGAADLVVPAGGNDTMAMDAGMVAVFNGPMPTGLVPVADANTRIWSDEPNGYLGEPVIILPDVDGDGLDDLYVATSSEIGRAWRFTGPLAGDVGVEEAATVFLEADRYDGVGLGFVLADLDGDDAPDLLVTTPFFDIDGGNSAGAAFRVAGPVPSGTIALDPSDAAVGVHASDYLGTALGSGDLDGDGRDDAVVAAPAVTHESHAYVFRAW